MTCSKSTWQIVVSESATIAFSHEERHLVKLLLIQISSLSLPYPELVILMFSSKISYPPLFIRSSLLPMMHHLARTSDHTHSSIFSINRQHVKSKMLELMVSLFHDIVICYVCTFCQSYSIEGNNVAASGCFIIS